MEAEPLIVFVTAPSRGEGERIAALLVGERLAACVNLIGPIGSIYRWQGEVCRDEEILMLIKTTGARYAALEARLREVHPYDVPEVLALAIERGSAAYIDWLRDATADR